MLHQLTLSTLSIQMLVYDFLSHSADQYHNNLAIVSGRDRISYRELANYADTSALSLLNKGLRRGDRAAILTDNPVHYISCYFAILKAGGIVVGLNTQTSERSLTHAISDCRPTFVFLSGRSRKYTPFLETFPTVQEVVDIEALIKEQLAATVLPINTVPPVKADDVAQIIYTSGTTGRPKGVMLTHVNLVSNTLATIEYLKLTDRDSVMAVLPFFYSYGNSVMLTHIAAGGTLVVNQSFVYPNLILEQMKDERVTGLSGVPSTFALLLHRSAIHDYTFPHLRYLTQAGAAMSPQLATRLKILFPQAEIFIMYGQTEAAPRLSYLPPHELARKPGSIGKAIPGVTLEILREDGSPASPNEIGEIVAGGNSIMKGYWQHEEETSAVLRRGKLWTGDLAYCDEEGFFYMVSRKSDMIKSGSHKIAPKEIEDILLEIEGITEAAVIGVKDEILGELIYACLVAEPGKNITEKDTLTFCRKYLPAFKVPHKIIFVKDLPKTASGKVEKNLLKEQKKFKQI